MATENQIVLVGNLTRDPELKFTTSGKSVCSFSIAYSNRIRTDAGGWEDGKTSFFDIECWDKQGENVATLTKGTRVTVIAEAKQDSWMHEVEGAEPQKRSKVVFVAREVAASLRWATVDVVKNAKGESSPAFGDSVPAAVGAEEDPF